MQLKSSIVDENVRDFRAALRLDEPGILKCKIISSNFDENIVSNFLYLFKTHKNLHSQFPSRFSISAWATPSSRSPWK